MGKHEPSTRNRILEAADKLFRASGIRAVSVDAVAEKAGLTKRSVYYHFRSKDDLIAAHLEKRDHPGLLLFQRWFAETEGQLGAQIQGIFTNLAKSARHPRWKGCGFLRTSVELVNLPGHPANIVARQHKMRVEDWLYSVFLKEFEAEDIARQLARQVILLLDGAFSVVLLHRDASYFETAGQAAAALISAQLLPHGVGQTSKLTD